jgi:diacylglycerol O-acyltransferase
MFNVRISGSRRFAAQSFSLERFKAIGKAAAATINDVTLAVCAGTLRRYLVAHSALPDKPLIAMVPVSVRAEGQDGGNQISILLANLGTHLDDPLERVKLIVESTTLAKDRLAKMHRLERVAHAAAMSAPMGPSMVTGHARKHPIYNVVISNVPGPKHTLYLDGMRLDESYPLSIPVDYLALNITITGYGDELGFGYIACRRSVPALQRMLDYTDEAIQELELALDLDARSAG